jgi:hypothetical protein
MKRTTLFATLIIGTIAATVLARGFGGGISRGGGHGSGYLAYALSGANDEPYDTVLDLPYYGGGANPPGLENASGTGFGHPMGLSSAQAVNAEASMAPAQPSPISSAQAFTSEASRLGIRVGGFSPGEFGPMLSNGRLPTDMGMQQAGTLARGGNSTADLRVQGNAVRKAFKNYQAFGTSWYRDHPKAWRTNGHLDLWKGVSWNDLNSTFGNGWDAFPYDYGTELTYDGNVVYLEGRPIAQSNLYNERAAELARIGSQSAAGYATTWMPLGVFEAIPPNQKSSNMLMQLAVSKDGILRGNFYDTADQNVQPLEGSIDKNIARAVWFVADKRDILFDTSLYNLTRRELAVLTHIGKDKNQRWTLVRLQPSAGAATSR